jgi:hypothetical protein
LESNERSDALIKKLELGKQNQQEIIVKTLAKVLRANNMVLAEHLQILNIKSEEFKAKKEDLEDLQQFKTLSSLDPEMSRKLIASQKEKCQMELQAFLKEEEEFNLKFEQEAKDAEQMVIEKVSAIIERARQNLDKREKSKISQSYSENQRLKFEISRHENYHAQLALELKEIKKENISLKMLKAEFMEQDRPKKLHELMTCRPEMDVIVNEA